MTSAVIQRLMWKEYRTQRAFGFALLAMVVALQLLYLCVSRADPSVHAVVVFTVALCFSALHAAGVGGTLFATEKETGVFDTLRALPLGAGRLLAAKMVYGLIDVAVFFVAAWLAALVLSGRLPEGAAHGQLVAGWGMATLELFVWGVLFSLVTARPLAAALLAIAAATTIQHFALAGRLPWDLPGLDEQRLPLRAALVGLVAVIDVAVGLRWLHTDGRRRKVSAARESMRRTATKSVSERPPLGVVRLMWQHWRQSRLFFAICGGVAILVLGYVFFAQRYRLEQQPFPSQVTGQFTVAAWLVGALLGVGVFLGDQRQRHYRFFAEHGAKAKAVWRSRQLVGLLGLAILLLALVPTCLLLLANTVDPFPLHGFANNYGPILVPSSVVSAVATCLAVALAAVLAYSAGQFCSLCCRSGILATAFGVFLAGGLCLWFGAMVILAVPQWWSVLPLPIALLVATRLRTGDWIRERYGLRAWLAPGLVAALPFAAVLALVPVYRITSVPNMDPGFDTAAYARLATPEERTTGDLYRMAMDSFVPAATLPARDPQQADDPDFQIEYKPALSDRARRWLAANKRTLAVALEAADRAECQLYEPSNMRTYYPNPRAGMAELVQLADYSALSLEIDGRLDDAAERLLAALRMAKHARIRARDAGECSTVELRVYYHLSFWAARPGQTAAQVRAMVRRLEAFDRVDPHWADPIKTDYFFGQAMVGDGEAAMPLLSTVTPRADEVAHYMVARWMPWEVARARRLIAANTNGDLRTFVELQRRLQTNQECAFLAPVQRSESWRPSVSMFPTLDPIPQTEVLVNVGLQRLSVCRMTRLALAARAWQLEHGEMPKSLDSLIGPVLDSMPLDPYTGKPFRWFPEGQTVPFQWWSGFVPGGTPLIRNSLDEHDRHSMLLPIPSANSPSEKPPARPAAKP